MHNLVLLLPKHYGDLLASWKLCSRLQAHEIVDNLRDLVSLDDHKELSGRAIDGLDVHLDAREECPVSGEFHDAVKIPSGLTGLGKLVFVDTGAFHRDMVTDGTTVRLSPRDSHVRLDDIMFVIHSVLHTPERALCNGINLCMEGSHAPQSSDFAREDGARVIGRFAACDVHMLADEEVLARQIRNHELDRHSISVFALVLDRVVGSVPEAVPKLFLDVQWVCVCFESGEHEFPRSLGSSAGHSSRLASRTWSRGLDLVLLLAECKMQTELVGFSACTRSLACRTHIPRVSMDSSLSSIDPRIEWIQGFT